MDFRGSSRKSQFETNGNTTSPLCERNHSPRTSRKFHLETIGDRQILNPPLCRVERNSGQYILANSRVFGQTINLVDYIVIRRILQKCQQQSEAFVRKQQSVVQYRIVISSTNQSTKGFVTTKICGIRSRISEFDYLTGHSGNSIPQ